MLSRQICTLVMFLSALGGPVATHAADVSGGVIITGHGPERPMVEDVAGAFEKTYPAAYVDITWSRNAKIFQLVRSGEADIAVAGQAEADLQAHQVAWDGIAIVVNAYNPVLDVTKQQVADIFTGKVKYWSELGGDDHRIVIVNRHRTQNLTYAFEHELDIVGQIPDSAVIIGTEQRATNKVVGTLPPRSAVTFMSLKPALTAVRTGAGVRLLLVDTVEPEWPTIKDEGYPLRRPVLFLTRKDASPTAKAFIAFALSAKGQRIINRSYTSLDRRR